MRYFQKREEWKITDLLMNPMIIMMLLPLLLITVLPKMMGDPETQKEMQEMQRNMANTQNQVMEQYIYCHIGQGERKIRFINNTTLIPFCNIFQMPEVSEVFANLFGGGGSSSSQEKTKKRQNRVQRKL